MFFWIRTCRKLSKERKKKEGHYRKLTNLLGFSLFLLPASWFHLFSHIFSKVSEITLISGTVMHFSLERYSQEILGREMGSCFLLKDSSTVLGW